VEEAFDEFGGRDSVGGPITVAKEMYSHEAVARMMALCTYYTLFDNFLQRVQKLPKKPSCKRFAQLSEVIS